jgi:membrane-associated protease RseP (regulator of RpoE activity)
MHMRDVFQWGAERLPRQAAAGVAALILAAPLAAQVATPAGVRRDSVVMLRLRPSADLERKLKARLDSLRIMLEREPVTSSDRAQLRQETEQLLMELSELSRANAEIAARFATEFGARAGEAVGRVMLQVGPGERRAFQVAMPRGWIGILADAPHDRRIVGDSHLIRYLEYPAIVSVDPNSPAARAGITPGDVLVAYDHTDVREHEINLSRLLVPNRRLSVTVRRDGERKDYEMTVARATDAFIREQREFTIEMRDSTGGVLGSGGRRPTKLPLATSGPQGTRVAVGRMPSPGDGPIFVLRPSMSSGMLWGAQLSKIGTGLGQALGVKAGVLVISVVQATPAQRAGLADGDVIVKANGQLVTDVEMLLRTTAERDDERALDLEVMRAKKPVKLTVRWK